MLRNLLCLLALVTTPSLFAQDKKFEFGKVTPAEVAMVRYDKDTAASAVYLQEWGDAYINSTTYRVVFEYHARIKILKKDGLKLADFEIPLYKQKDNAETLFSLKAASYNLQPGRIEEMTLDKKNVFTEDRSKYSTVKKFAVPNVRVGSVIEVAYTIESPFTMNFRSWQFQGDYPKIYSEYQATIPGIFIYNISLRGFLSLTKNEASVMDNCFPRVRCARMNWAMKDIPAFVEEDYMTAKSNYLASLNFELSEVHHFDGRVDKVTKSWKDVDHELRTDDKFGLQLKRGKEIVDTYVDLVTLGETDELKKAKSIFDFIKYHYRWNEVYGKYSEFGIKKAFDTKTGNVGDINLSLIAALRYAGLNVEPMLLSTRWNGVATEIYPVMTDFNYVVAKLNIGKDTYLLDATEDIYPFGLIPERCLNGNGRVLGTDSLYWYPLKSNHKDRRVSMLNVTLSADGTFTGSLSTTYYGYAAVKTRAKIAEFSTHQEYFNKLTAGWDEMEVTKSDVANFDDINSPLTQNIEFTMKPFEHQQAFLFNPFIVERWKQNPFKSNERLYPVDFGPSIEQTLILNFSYADTFEIVNLPEKVALGLPNKGGRFVAEAVNNVNQVSCSYMLAITKPYYSSQEYHYLKELFNVIVRVQNNDIMIQRKQ